MTECFCGLPSCGPAAYEWTCKTSGNVVLLCVGCCAAWRESARDKSMLLAPSRIREVVH